MEKRYLNAKEAAVYLGMSRGTFEKLRGQIKAIKYPGIARVWYDKQDLDELVEGMKC